jgi:Hg(II)-responsive transcriptional regulator
MNDKQSQLTIGRIAKLADVGIDTIRFYERRGLLPAPARTASGYRIYAPDTVGRLNFIRRAKDLGFSLEEISTLLYLQDSGGAKTEIREITQRKLEHIDTKIDNLERMRAVLHDLHQQCVGSGDIDGCPIIEALADEDVELALTAAPQAQHGTKT